MNMYDLINVKFNVAGYYIPGANEKREDAFEKAKKEYINAMKRSIQNAESLTAEMFFK